MRLETTPGGSVAGESTVPGDKSIAHRWLILACTARGPSRLGGVPVSLDVRSSAGCLAEVTPVARASLDAWVSNAASDLEAGGSTWNLTSMSQRGAILEVDGEGRERLVEAGGPLRCGNSGTTMRLLMGTMAAAPFTTRFVGDGSLSARPMERVAGPLREMGASVASEDGHAPITVRGGRLRGIRHRSPIPSAQVKSAVLLAGIAAEGTTTIEEPIPTRDHTERALAALGAPVRWSRGRVSVRRFQHQGFSATVPGDPSAAAFLVAAAALTGSSLTIRGVGLNPSRLAFLQVLERMGLRTSTAIDHEELGEPVGALTVSASDGFSPVEVPADELPLVVDEVAMLAAVAAHASGESSFRGGAELRVKESDRLRALAGGINELGGGAAVEEDDLIVQGGGLRGGRTSARADHRIAMALTVAGLAAAGPCVVDGAEVADVSFPGFARTLARLGAPVEMLG